MKLRNLVERGTAKVVHRRDPARSLHSLYGHSMKHRLTTATTARIVLVFAVLSVLVSVFSQEPGNSRVSAAKRNADWPVYLGDKAATHYSALDQINKSNVSRLKVAWSYDTGGRGEFQSNGLVIDGVLYTASPTRKVIALKAATGKEVWKFDPKTVRAGEPGRRQRGVVYWASGNDRRIFTGSGAYLYALDAATGKLITVFGDNGSIHLGDGVEVHNRDGPPSVVINTPGIIYKDMYIVGGLTNGPGTIRAYDVRTGKIKWIFYIIPRPGEYGYHSWPPEAYKTAGGASNWSGMALDEQRGIVYVPTETAEPDFWGGDRHGANLFANSLLALDANTGKRLWHYQLVHHDLLDKDLPTPPVLLTVRRHGLTIDAVAQGTKNGLLFVFDRVTGEPLWPIHEVPVPQNELPGEQTWPTQPVPTKPPPLTRQIYTPYDVSNISREANELTALRLKQVGSLRRVSGAQPEGDDHLSGVRRRHGMGRRGCRSRGHLLRERQRNSLDLSDGRVTKSRRNPRVVGRARLHDSLRLLPRT